MLREADPPEAELASFARGRDNASSASRDLISAWTGFVTEAEAEVKMRREEQQIADLEAEMERLDGLLGGLIVELENLETTDVTD